MIRPVQLPELSGDLGVKEFPVVGILGKTTTMDSSDQSSVEIKGRDLDLLSRRLAVT